MLLSALQVIRPRLSCPTSHPAVRKWHTLRVRRANPAAPRRVPTPLVFLAAPGWPSAHAAPREGEANAEESAEKVFERWTDTFGEHGWDATLLDVGLDEGKRGEGIIQAAEAELSAALRKHAAFPPLLIAHGAAALIAQAYVSSAPLTGLVLHDAPLSLSHAKKRSLLPLSDKTEEFDFEVRFPAACAWSAAELARQKEEGSPWYDIHRIESEREEEAGESLERIVWELHQEGAKAALQWAEDEGISSAAKAAASSPTESSVIGFDDVVEEQDNDELEWEAETVDPTTEVESTPSTSTSTKMSPPKWFTASYTFSTQGSKKLPLNIPESDLSESFIRGGGPGGQAINKLSTCVALLHVPSATRVVCQETRSRTQNRVIARRRMSRLLEELVRGQQSVNAKERDKERRKKSNREKKAKRRAREREVEKK